MYSFQGPGPLKTTAGKITLNTSSLITYAQSYEFTLILSKDDRTAMVTLEVNVGSAPAPIVSVECLNAADSCFPVAGGIMVNPTKRLAVIGNCEEECEGDLSYHWSLVPPEEEDPKPNYVSCPTLYRGFRE